MRLLMIDDDEALADIISQHLIQQHYAVDIATDGHMGLEFVDLFSYDLIILDLMLPDLDGRTICTRIRQGQHQMPILMLTARDKAEDKIEGLDAGADDYIVKPIHLPELLARIRALLRRASSTTPTELEWGRLKLDPCRFEATYDQHLVGLTPKEYSILELFLRSPQQSHTLDGIIDNIWALEKPPSLYAIRTHIKSIRHKLKDLGAPSDFIETLYGFGYRLNPAYHQAKVPQATQSAEMATRSAQIKTMTQELWKKHQDEIVARIQLLEQVVQSIGAGSVTDDNVQEGIQVAHKLAGSLGCFSFQQGSRLAREIETQLQTFPEITAPSPDLPRLVQQLRDSIHHSPPQAEGDRRHLLVYSRQPQLLQQLEAETSNYGFTLTSVLDSNTLSKQIQINRPHVILLDIATPEKGLELLVRLQDKVLNIPILVILQDCPLQQRLDYIHQGVSRVFSHPVSAPSLLDTARQLDEASHRGATLLLVDDDPLLLSLMNRHLSTLGFGVKTLETPTRFWSCLQETKPDLVILDVDMPEINGFELCRLLRADPDWTHIPIIFLTGHPKSKTEDQAFIAGADDFIPKDCSIQRLAMRIQNRLRKTVPQTRVNGV